MGDDAIATALEKVKLITALEDLQKRDPELFNLVGELTILDIESYKKVKSYANKLINSSIR